MGVTVAAETNLTPSILARRHTTSQNRVRPPSEKVSSNRSGMAVGITAMIFAPFFEISITRHSHCTRPFTLIQAHR